YNLDAGMTADDDNLPPRMFNEPAPSGVNQGNISQLALLLPEYYRLRGWSEDGVPSPETLTRLAL
ncbi:MAG: aldehyde ferredoxin oxidoreductase, partial [Hyphomicrobiales bacterium]